MPPAPQKFTQKKDGFTNVDGISEGGDSSLSEYDKRVLGNFEMIILDKNPKAGTIIPFQFPPRVVSDVKQAIFVTKRFPAGWEPFKIYFGSEARVLTIEAEWISTDESQGNGYIAKNIAKMFRDIRQYFYQATISTGGVSGGKDSKYPTVKLRAYEIVPIPAFFRLMAFNVAFGPELASTSDLSETFPVYAKTTFQLELVTSNKATVEAANQLGKPALGRTEKDPGIFKIGPLSPLELKWF